MTSHDLVVTPFEFKVRNCTRVPGGVGAGPSRLGVSVEIAVEGSIALGTQSAIESSAGRASCAGGSRKCGGTGSGWIDGGRECGEQNAVSGG